MVFSDTVQPINLGTAFVGGGSTAVLSGWGLYEVTSGLIPNNLQFLHVYTLTNSVCRSSHLNRPNIYESSICTYSKFGEGTCNGDSGGPLVLGDTVIGIVSWNLGCATIFPDVYARVSSFVPWIQFQINTE